MSCQTILYGKQTQNKSTGTARGDLEYAFDYLRSKYKSKDILKTNRQRKTEIRFKYKTTGKIKSSKIPGLYLFRSTDINTIKIYNTR